MIYRIMKRKLELHAPDPKPKVLPTPDTTTEFSEPRNYYKTPLKVPQEKQVAKQNNKTVTNCKDEDAVATIKKKNTTTTSRRRTVDTMPKIPTATPVVIVEKDAIPQKKKNAATTTTTERTRTVETVPKIPTATHVVVVKDLGGGLNNNNVLPLPTKTTHAASNRGRFFGRLDHGSSSHHQRRRTHRSIRRSDSALAA